MFNSNEYLKHHGFFGYVVDKETGEMKDRDIAEYLEYRGRADALPWPDSVKI